MGDAFMEFFAIGKLPETWIRTFIILVPKKPNADDYRTISLCTALYKSCAKLMVERMKPILPRLIYLEQGNFH